MINQKDNYVLVIGASNIDLIGQSKDKIVLNESNPAKISYCPGGVARNIAENISNLGNNCQLITAMGDDYFGKLIKKSCIKSGINIENSILDDKESTSLYISIHNNDSEMFLSLNETNITNKITPQFLESKKSIILNASIIVLDTNLSQESLNYIFENYDKNIFVDTVSIFKAKKILNHLDKIHTLKPNKAEALYLADIKSAELNSIERAADFFHHQGVKRSLISLGENGAFLSENNKSKFFSQKLNFSVNVTGAGDALMAGLVHSYLKEWDWEYSVKFSLGAAYLATCSLETVNNNLNERNVLRVLEKTNDN